MSLKANLTFSDEVDADDGQQQQQQQQQQPMHTMQDTQGDAFSIIINNPTHEDVLQQEDESLQDLPNNEILEIEDFNQSKIATDNDSQSKIANPTSTFKQQTGQNNNSNQILVASGVNLNSSLKSPTLQRRGTGNLSKKGKRYQKTAKYVQEYSVTQNKYGMTCYALVPIKKSPKPQDKNNNKQQSPSHMKENLSVSAHSWTADEHDSNAGPDSQRFIKSGGNLIHEEKQQQQQQQQQNSKRIRVGRINSNLNSTMQSVMSSTKSAKNSVNQKSRQSRKQSQQMSEFDSQYLQTTNQNTRNNARARCLSGLVQSVGSKYQTTTQPATSNQHGVLGEYNENGLSSAQFAKKFNRNQISNSIRTLSPDPDQNHQHQQNQRGMNVRQSQPAATRTRPLSSNLTSGRGVVVGMNKGGGLVPMASNNNYNNINKNSQFGSTANITVYPTQQPSQQQYIGGIHSRDTNHLGSVNSRNQFYNNTHQAGMGRFQIEQGLMTLNQDDAYNRVRRSMKIWGNQNKKNLHKFQFRQNLLQSQNVCRTVDNTGLQAFSPVQQNNQMQQSIGLKRKLTKIEIDEKNFTGIDPSSPKKKSQSPVRQTSSPSPPPLMKRTTTLSPCPYKKVSKLEELLTKYNFAVVGEDRELIYVPPNQSGDEIQTFKAKRLLKNIEKLYHETDGDILMKTKNDQSIDEKSFKQKFYTLVKRKDTKISEGDRKQVIKNFKTLSHKFDHHDDLKEKIPYKEPQTKTSDLMLDTLKPLIGLPPYQQVCHDLMTLLEETRQMDALTSQKNYDIFEAEGHLRGDSLYFMVKQNHKYLKGKIGKEFLPEERISGIENGTDKSIYDRLSKFLRKIAVPNVKNYPGSNKSHYEILKARQEKAEKAKLAQVSKTKKPTVKIPKKYEKFLVDLI